MKNGSDVIIIGGGPCGSFTALNLAKLGSDVIVFEEHDEIGVPSHCAGHVSIKGLKRLGLYPLPARIVENTFSGAVFHSPGGKRFSIRLSSPVTCAVDRVLFDKHIAQLAEDAGARYFLRSRVESLIVEDGVVKGATVSQDGRTEKHSTKIVVDAEGMPSRLLKQAGLPTLNRSKTVNAVMAEVESVEDAEPDEVHVFFGRDYAPGFYAWLIPKRDGKAKVGLAAKAGNPRELLKRLMMGHPAASKMLRSARILQTAFHPITLGGPIPKTYSDGFMVVGDAASHVKPTTGGGLILGMTCGEIAGEVANQSLHQGDFSSEFLSAYHRRCKQVLGFDMRIMLRVRRMLDAMSDGRVDEAIDFCRRLGVDSLLRNLNDIDFQGQALLRVLPDPRSLPLLFYLLYLSLSANP